MERWYFHGKGAQQCAWFKGGDCDTSGLEKVAQNNARLQRACSNREDDLDTVGELLVAGYGRVS